MAQTFGQITLAAVGKMRTKMWLSAQQEYIKRLTRYTKFSLVEVKDVVGRGQPDSVAMQQEGAQLLKAAAKSRHIVLLSSDGEEMTSPELAGFIKKRVESYGRIVFLVGGPLGFSDEVIAAAHTQLSLSRLTFPHELARVLFLEQLYRAFTILNNENYHK